MPASKAGLFLNLEPVVGSGLGIVILRERLAGSGQTMSAPPTIAPYVSLRGHGVKGA